MSAPGFYTLVSDGARIALRVTPNARSNRIGGPQTRADGSCVLIVRVTAPPNKGAANDAVIALVAKALGLSKSTLSLASGQTSRTKVIRARAPHDVLRSALDALATQ